MKKFILCLLVFLIAVPTATANTITGMAVDIDPNHLVSRAVYARLVSYDADKGTVRMEIITPEVFRADEIQSLSVGDSIFTDGKEVLITSISEYDGYIVLNRENGESPDNSVWLYESLDFNYHRADVNDDFWLTVATIDVPLPDSIVYVDASNPTAELPAVYGKEELVSAVCAKDGSETSLNNAMVFFNAAGDLVIVKRLYVPW